MNALKRSTTYITCLYNEMPNNKKDLSWRVAIKKNKKINFKGFGTPPMCSVFQCTVFKLDS